MKTTIDFTRLAQDIKQWGLDLGFDAVGITDIDLTVAEKYLAQWLQEGFHGDMQYMQKHGSKRTRPAELVPGTVRIISARMNYFPPDADIVNTLRDKQRAYIARYALGRDYHKVVRKGLLRLADKISCEVKESSYRVFVDSAPVMEKAIAEKAGLGWIGKNTLLLNKNSGSWFVLGEIYTNLPLPLDTSSAAHCGSCRACLDICPTNAFVGPYQLDARRCISYLTIENRGSIPLELRSQIGNRIFGCDDCQLVCPWNKFAKVTPLTDFHARHSLNYTTLIELFMWSETEYLSKTEGSALRRTGYIGWLRNIAVALGNAPTSPKIISALQARLHHESALVREHVAWALARQEERARFTNSSVKSSS